MKLRNQVLTLSLATLLVPWAGWKLVQELEAFLRAGQESQLLGTAHTVAQALPAEFQAEMIKSRTQVLHLRTLPAPLQLDGYTDDWTGADQGLDFGSEDGQLELRVLAGAYAGQVYLHCRVEDGSRVRDPAGGQGRMSDAIVLFLRSARGMLSFRIQSAAPGPLTLSSQTDARGQLEGHWLDTTEGYQVELALPLAPGPVDLSIGAVDAGWTPAGVRAPREAGTLKDQRPERWLGLARPMDGLGGWLAGVTPPGTRAWIVDAAGWVVAESGVPPAPGDRTLTWAERTLYRAVAGSRTGFASGRPDEIVRFDDPLVERARRGEQAQDWSQDPESAVVRNTVAVPLTVQGAAHGAVVMEASTDGLLLVTNRALGRIMLTTLLLTLAVAIGLWFFATRLSRRVQRLSGAVSKAMDDVRQPSELPMAGDRDELGELARNNVRLLRAVSEYHRYLQQLPRRLSHELKTPLAITRSSLDNLASRELDEEASRYLERAREGLDRQSAIVRDMSEASRLEAAIEASEWENVDLVDVVGHCVEAYRGLHPGRDIGLQVPDTPCPYRCAPDLLAQALDKLVDNAVSLTGPEHRIELRLARAANGYRLGVLNTGSRLPDILPERLFDSLVSVREKGGGRHLGLGLHIVRLVAEAHGGRVEALNLDSGDGVEFVLYLAAG